MLRLCTHASWHNRDLSLWLQPGENGCLGTGPQLAEGCQLPSRWLFLAPYSDVRITALVGEPGFYGRRDFARPGSIELESEAGRWRVIISARARIRVCQLGEKGCE